MAVPVQETGMSSFLVEWSKVRSGGVVDLYKYRKHELGERAGSCEHDVCGVVEPARCLFETGDVVAEYRTEDEQVCWAVFVLDEDGEKVRRHVVVATEIGYENRKSVELFMAYVEAMEQSQRVERLLRMVSEELGKWIICLRRGRLTCG